MREKIFIELVLGQKGVKTVRKCISWLYYPNTSFILVEVWQDFMENYFEDLVIKILPECGHFLHLEKHKEVNKIILNFLSS